MLPNIPKAEKNITRKDKLTIWFLNKERGMIGSLLRLSIKRKHIIIMTENVSMPAICNEAHGYSIPAHENASRRGTTAKMRVITPG